MKNLNNVFTFVVDPGAAALLVCLHGAKLKGLDIGQEHLRLGLVAGISWNNNMN